MNLLQRIDVAVLFHSCPERIFFSCYRAAWGELNETVWNVPTHFRWRFCGIHVSNCEKGREKIHSFPGGFYLTWIIFESARDVSADVLESKINPVRENHPPAIAAGWYAPRRCWNSSLKSLHFLDEVKLLRRQQAWTDRRLLWRRQKNQSSTLTKEVKCLESFTESSSTEMPLYSIRV